MKMELKKPSANALLGVASIAVGLVSMVLDSKKEKKNIEDAAEKASKIVMEKLGKNEG